MWRTGGVVPLLLLLSFPVCAATFYVSTTGNAVTGDGSLGNPWATLSQACSNVPDDGSTVLVQNGTYDGRVRCNRRFVNHTIFKSENAYLAVLTNSGTEQILTSFGGANFTIEGFEFKRPPSSTGALMIQIQEDVQPAEDIVFRNNILHDSFNNDILKINNVCDNILVEGNVFYNQSGSDEHIDVNGVTNVIIQDNIFFNDFAGSGRTNGNDTSSYIVIKNSGEVALNENITVRRNIFLNWEGINGNPFVLVGEDGKPFHEAENVLIENNLMIGNSANEMRAAFGVKCAKDVTFRNNTVTGNLPSLAYALRLNLESVDSPNNENILFYNNIWSDPTGTMGVGPSGVTPDFSDGDASETTNGVIDNNLYYNGGAAIPPGDVLDMGDDASAIVGNPNLGSQAGVILPRWNDAQDEFLSGNTTIRDEFLRLVGLYGVPGAGSVALDAADPANTPVDDILGNGRDGSPDIGAYDTDGGVLILLSPSALPDGAVDEAYSETITASGGTGPYTFLVTSGALPGGLSLSTAGLLSGTPTAEGDFDFTVTATDNNTDTGFRNYSISITDCLFCDDFEDGVLDLTWNYLKPAWSENNGDLVATPGRKAIAIAPASFSGCTQCTVEAGMQTTGGVGNRVWLLAWYQSKGNTIEILMKEEADRWIVKQRLGGKVVASSKGTRTILPGVSYRVRMERVNSAFQLFVDDVSVLTLNASGNPSGTVGFQVKSTVGRFEEIRVY